MLGLQTRLSFVCCDVVGGVSIFEMTENTQKFGMQNSGFLLDTILHKSWKGVYKP